MIKQHLRSVRSLMLILAFASQFLISCATATVNPTNTVPAATSTTISLPPTWTSTPSIALSATLQPTRSPSSSSTPSLSTPTLTPQINSPTPGAGGTPTDSAEFVADVTIPDGTAMAAGQAFTKTWSLRNNGSSTWTTSYSIIFSQGTQMGAPATSPLTREVRPSETVDISLNMTAPMTNGSHTASFMLKNAAGKLFGVGQNATGLFYVTINVSAAAGTPVTPGTPGTPTTTPTPGTITPSAGGPTVTEASLAVDKSSYTGACPVRLNFTAGYTAQGTGSIVYQLEAGTDNPKFTFTLPGSQTVKYTTAGPNKLSTTYYLDIESSVNGWARFMVTGSNTLRSAQVNYTVTCQ